MRGFRHTFNSLLAAAGVPLRTRQLLMRHATSGTLTGDVYSDMKVLDLRGALDKLPALPLHDPSQADRNRATGTNGAANPVALTVAVRDGNSGQCLGSVDKPARPAAGSATLSRIVASAAGVKGNERPTHAVNRSLESGRLELHLLERNRGAEVGSGAPATTP